MHNRMSEETDVILLEQKLETFHIYCEQKNDSAALKELEQLLQEAEEKSSSFLHSKKMRELVHHILENVFLMNNKETPQTEKLLAHAFRVALAWIDFYKADVLWADLRELALYMGDKASHDIFATQSTLKAYPRLLAAFQESFNRLHYAKEELDPKLKAIQTLHDRVDLIHQSFKSPKSHAAVLSVSREKQQEQECAQLRLDSIEIAHYGKGLEEFLVGLREAIERGLLLTEQKQWSCHLKKVQQQNANLSNLIQRIHATLSTQAIISQLISIHQELGNTFGELDAIYQHYQKIPSTVEQTLNIEREQVRLKLLELQQVINYFNLALWLMPNTDEQYAQVLNKIDKLFVFFTYHLSVDHWERQLALAIDKAKNSPETPRKLSLVTLCLQRYLGTHPYHQLKREIREFNPDVDLPHALADYESLGAVEAILQRISPYLQRLEKHGLFAEATSFYTNIIQILDRNLSPSDRRTAPSPQQKLIKQVFERIRTELTITVVNIQKSKNEFLKTKQANMPPIPIDALGTWNTGREILAAKRRPQLPKSTPPAEILKAQTRYGKGFKEVVREIAEDIEQILGKAPNYCLAEIGSLSQKNSVPRSDFDFCLFMEEKDANSVAYMARWQHLFFLYFTALGETAHSESEKFPPGFRIDWGTNTWSRSELWDTPKKMVYFFDPHKTEASESESQLYYSLLKPIYVYGDKRLLQSYQEMMNERLAKPTHTNRPLYQQRALERLEKHARDHERLSADDANEELDIKSRYVQLLSFMALDMGLYYNLPTRHPFATMEALAKRGLVTHAYKEIFNQVLAELTAIRIKNHLKHRFQADWVVKASLSLEAKRAMQEADHLFLLPFNQAQQSLCDRKKVFSLSELDPKQDFMKELLDETVWQFLISAISTNLPSSLASRKVEIEGINTEKRELKEKIIKQLIDPSTGYFSEEKAKKFNLSGKRNVIPIKYRRHIIAYAKPFPELPGYERTVDLLGEAICPASLARNELFCFRVTSSPASPLTYPVLISEAVRGEMLKKRLELNSQEILEDIHPYYYAKFFIWTLMTNQEDHKEDNLLLVPVTDEFGEELMNPKTNRPWLRFVGIDNDHAFVTPLKEHTITDQLKSAFGKVAIEANVKTYIYCHELMQAPFDQPAVEEFLALDINTIMHNCLEALAAYNQRCFHLFGKEKLKEWYEQPERSAFLLGGLGEMGTENLYDKLFLTKILLSEALTKKKKDLNYSLPSPQRILSQVMASLAARYADAFAESTDRTLLSRFNHIGKHAYVNVYHRHQPRPAIEKRLERQSALSLRQTLSTMQIGQSDEYKAKETILLSKENYIKEYDLKTLERIIAQRSSLQSLRNKLYDPQVSRKEKFHACQRVSKLLPSLKIEFLNGSKNHPGLDFRRIIYQEKNQREPSSDRKVQEAVLKALAGVEFTKLRLNNCQGLTLPLLEKLILPSKAKTNPTLRILDISGCEKLNDDAIHFILTTCSQLEKLNISRLPKLKFLSCPAYQYFNKTLVPYFLENLQQLIITDCENLQQLWLKVPALQYFALSRCPKLIDPKCADMNIKEGNYVLDLSGWEQISEQNIKELQTFFARCCSGVVKLHVQGNYHTVDKDEKEISSKIVMPYMAYAKIANTTESLYQQPNKVDESEKQLVKPASLVKRPVASGGFFSSRNRGEAKREKYHYGENNTLTLKLMLVGKFAGKTQCINRFVHDRFDESTMLTIGIDFSSREVTLGNHSVKLQIWDTASQDCYRTIISAYFKGTNAFLLSFSLTDKQSFESVKSFAEEIDRYNVPCILVGTMCDLADKRMVSYKEAIRMKDEINAVTYIECSAKLRINIDEIFMAAAKAALEKMYRRDENIEMMESIPSGFSCQKRKE